MTQYYPPGYGLHLFGLVIPFPPAPVLWVVAVLDIVATVWAWRLRSRVPVLAVLLLASAYIAWVGAFSIGPIYVVLFVVQAIRLVLTLRRHR